MIINIIAKKKKNNIPLKRQYAYIHLSAKRFSQQQRCPLQSHSELNELTE